MIDKAKVLIIEDCERVVTAVERKLDALDGASILITGGTGFMGAWVAAMIVSLNSSFGKHIKLRVLARDKERFDERLGSLAESQGIDFIRCDVRSLLEIPKDINYVIHAAANPDNRYHSSNPIETMTTIADGTGMVLRAADRVSDLRMFLNVSSSSVYTTTQSSPLSESSEGIELNSVNKSPYAEAKRYAEVLCSAARSEARIPVSIIRPFTFIGPFHDLDAPWAINNFLRDVIQKRPIRILSDGKALRSFMYGADLAAWILTIMTKAKSGQIYNVGNPSGISLFDLAQKVADFARPHPEVVLNASLTGPVPSFNLVPDTMAAQKDFDLKIYTDIEKSISRTLTWYDILAKAR